MSNKFTLTFVLPYWIPIEGTIIEMEEEDSYTLKVVITSERGEKKTLTGKHLYPYTCFILNIEDKEEQVYEISAFSGETINRIHEFGLVKINSIIESIRMETDLLHLHEITTTDLELFSIIEINGRRLPYITSPHKYVAEHNRNISHETFKIAWSRINDNLTYKFFYDKARSDFILGKNSDSIIGLQIAFEGFIDELLKKFIEINFFPDSRKSAILESKFRHKIEHHLSKFFKRDLHFDKNPFIKSWKEYIYTPRNKIVHDGQKALTLSGRKALKIFIKVHNYLVKSANKTLQTNHFTEVKIGSVNLWNGQTEEIKKLSDERLLPDNLKGKLQLFLKSSHIRLASFINKQYTIYKLNKLIKKNGV